MTLNENITSKIKALEEASKRPEIQNASNAVNDKIEDLLEEIERSQEDH